MFKVKLSILALILCQLVNFSVGSTAHKEFDQLTSALDKFCSAFSLADLLPSQGNAVNSLLSPFSITQSLSMLLSSARGETQTEMMNALRYNNLTLEYINKGYRSLIDYYDKNRRVTLTSTSLALLKKDLHLEKDFKHDLKKNYKVVVEKVHFKSPETLKEINNFVKKNTRSGILKMLNELEPKTQMALINAYYFKGGWVNKFDDSVTEIFKNSDSTTTRVKMMYHEGDYDYIENESEQTVFIPYSGNVTMIIVSPHEYESSSSFEKLILKMKSNDEIFYHNPSDKELKKVHLRLPKFKISHYIDSIKVFENDYVKITELFDPDKANLSEISKKLFISKAIHKAHIDMNLKGTEVGAGSFEEFQIKSSPRNVGLKLVKTFIARKSPNETSSNETKIMIVNKPFIFRIVDDLNNLVLMQGAIRKL